MFCLEPLSPAYKVAGMIRDADATAIRLDIVDATVELNDCCLCLIPPARKQQPRTSRILDRIDPSMEACTMRISSLRRATIETCILLLAKATDIHHVCRCQHCGYWRSVPRYMYGAEVGVVGGL